MSDSFRLSPIENIALNGISSLPLKGLIVIVGPNSSGKTTLLREIHGAVSGLERKLLVIETISYRSLPSVETVLNRFLTTKDLEIVHDPGQGERFRKVRHQYGTQTGIGGEWTRKEIASWCGQQENFVRQQLTGSTRGTSYLQNLGLLECSALFIDNRLSITQSGGLFDTVQGIPTTALQALRLDEEAEDRLTNEILKVFRRGAWVDKSGGGTFGIKISDDDLLPDYKERTSPSKMKVFRNIDTEGEGIRSYVAICITLLLAQRPLCLIDEPEMCLHPPQARAIGRFIGEYGAQQEACTLVATHSSHVLRGILEKNKEVSVIRLKHREKGFFATHVSPEILTRATRKPLSRSEIILDGLFTEGVVLCESDGDRIVYESVLQTLSQSYPDLRFIPVGGVGGFKETAKLFRALEVPIAIASDFDLLLKSELSEIVGVLDVADLSALKAKINGLQEVILKVAKGLTAEEAIIRAEDVVQSIKTRTARDQRGNFELVSELRRELSLLSRELSPQQDLKSKGLAGAPESLRGEISSLITELKRSGLFLVPCGELESWVPMLMTGVTRENKSLWATEAARQIEDHGEREGDIWAYVRSIVDYFERRPESD
ncbi:MAG: hypothetical protein CV089_17300 [Nitrospira sp. WS110]|nr:hypothetical protein [Nitrospira sp. WS110]